MGQHNVKVFIGQWLVAMLLPGLVWAGEVGNPTTSSTRTGELRLTVDGNLVSL
jgi:hypothetical protein